VYLLDVNMLIALAWDDHVHHQAAHAWFSTCAQIGFATCNVTQSGFIRVSLNPKVVRCGMNTTDAIAKLKSITSQPKHKFWEDGPVQIESELWQTVTGHGEVTDMNLLLIAQRHGGRLATFEGAIRNRIPSKDRLHVEVIPAK
jgi:toxin-antitoxin system PIN domain toxin